MRKSLLRQLTLIAILGPFGLFYTNVVVALTIVFSTLIVVYSFAEPLSITHLLYVLPTAMIVSFAFGIFLVDKHNRQHTKDFQLSTYYGNVSCKIIRKESAERNYHHALNKVRRKKIFSNFAAVFSASLCTIYSVLIVKQHITIFAPDFASTATTQASFEPSTSLNSSSESPRWNHKQQGTTFTSEIKAMDYASSSDGLYLPVIKLSCNDNNYKISFNVNEILGTNSAPISITINDKPSINQKWVLDSTYQSASTPSTKELMSQLKSARMISVGYKPFGQLSEKTARFNLSGSAREISAFKQTCSSLPSIASN